MTRGSHDARTATLMQLIDDLEAQISNGRRIFGTGSVNIDGARALEIIDRLRQQIPVELEQARRIVRERQEIIISAQDEARKIVDEANSRVEYLVSESGILAEARQRSEEQLRQAEANANRTSEGAERFAVSVIDAVQGTLREQLEELERARAYIHELHQRERSSSY